MTTAAVNSPIKINSTPFCDASYKGVRVFGQFLGRSLYALGLLIVSVACRIFNRDLGCMYVSMARFQFNRGGSALVTYFKFGDKLIDFSYNGCVIASSSDTEQNALRARYGSNTVDRWLQIGTDAIPLNPEKLKRVEQGVCLGMTLVFMKEYLQQIQIGVSPMEAIHEVSLRYVTGASDEAQLAQIFYSALGSTQLIEREWVTLDAAMDRRQTDILRWLKEQQELARTLPREQILAQLTLVQTQFNERFNSFRSDAFSNKIRAISRIEAQCDEIVGNQFDLQMGPARIYAQEEISVEYDVQFSQFLEELSNGCYAGGFRAKECAHAVTLIKVSDNQYFFFDPNLGTLALKRNEIAGTLWNIGRSFYLRNGLCSLSLSSCRLRH